MTDDDRETAADAALARYFEEHAAEVAASRVLARFRENLPPPQAPRIPAASSPPPPGSRFAVPVRSLAPVLALILLALAAGLPRRPPTVGLSIDVPDAVLVDGARAATARPGTTLRATAPARATLDDLEIALQTGAALKLVSLPDSRGGGRLTVRQIEGDVVYRYRPGARAPLLIDVPGGAVRVTGTVFRIRMTPGLVEVAVAEGTVEVAGEETVRLPAGRSIQLRGNGALTPPRPFNPIADPSFSGTHNIGVGSSR